MGVDMGVHAYKQSVIRSFINSCSLIRIQSCLPYLSMTYRDFADVPSPRFTPRFSVSSGGNVVSNGAMAPLDMGIRIHCLWQRNQAAEFNEQTRPTIWMECSQRSSTTLNLESIWPLMVVNRLRTASSQNTCALSGVTRGLWAFVLSRVMYHFRPESGT
jgi:hypothetical protein